MIDITNDIKKSPEYIEANTELNKLRKHLDSDIEAYNNGAISAEQFTSKLWKLQLNLNTTYYSHASIYKLVTTLNKKYKRLHDDIFNTISLNAAKSETL